MDDNTYPELRISWTLLRTHTECAQKAKLYRERKKNKTQNVRNFFHGNVSDSVMRKWVELPDRDSVRMSSLVEEMFDEEEKRVTERDGILKWSHTEDKKTMMGFVETLCDRLEPILERLILPYEYELAKRFSVPVKLPDPSGGKSTVRLNGELDALVYLPDGYSIWDLKATKDDSYWRKTIGQLTFYDVAMWAEHGKYAQRTGLIQPMCKQQVLEVGITDESRRQLLMQVSSMAIDMWKEYAPVREDMSLCKFCECRHACAKFGRVGGRVPLTTSAPVRIEEGTSDE